jgi:hypothetical protein
LDLFGFNDHSQLTLASANWEEKTQTTHAAVLSLEDLEERPSSREVNQTMRQALQVRKQKMLEGGEFPSSRVIIAVIPEREVAELCLQASRADLERERRTPG